MLIKKGNKEIIVFGYGDVVISCNSRKGKGVVLLHHTKEGEIGRGDNLEFEQLPMSRIRFDNVESLDVYIGMLKNMRKQMKQDNKPKVFKYNLTWSEK